MNDAVTMRVVGVVSFLFWLAPLHAQTQAEMSAEARADFKKADVDLNEAYQAVLAKISPAEKQKLKEAQRAWIASRDAEAARAAKEAEGGSMAPTLRYQTMTELTRKRITELKAMIDKENASRAQTEAPQSEEKEASSVAQAEASPRPTSDSDSRRRIENGEQEPVAFEKIVDASPDRKFAVLISCSGEPEDPNNIESNLITAVKLVALPSKKTVLDLQNYNGSPARVIWSEDSNWLAYALSSGPRVTDTYVYHRAGEDFNELKTDDLKVGVQGDVRNEYVRPLRWIKPSVLLLEQTDIVRGSGDSSALQFTAAFNQKTGKFQITSKKNIQHSKK